MIIYLAPLLLAAPLLFMQVDFRRLGGAAWRDHDYRAVLDALQDAVLVFDEETRLVYLNRAAREWFATGETADDATGAVCAQIAPAHDLAALLADGGQVLLTVGPRQVEAAAWRIAVQDIQHTALVLHDVTVAQALLSQERRRAHELAAMNKLSAALNTSLKIDELLEVVVYSVDQAIDCCGSAIFLMDNERGLLSLIKGRGLSEAFVRANQNVTPRLGGHGQVVLDRYPLIVHDVEQSGHSPELVSQLMAEGIHAYADFPLRGREHVLGALTVYYSGPQLFDEYELELLTSFANQLTLALENARMYERTDRALARRVEQLAAIEEIGRELAATLDLTGVFNMVLERAMGSTGASAGFLALGPFNDGRLELILDRGYPPGALDQVREQGWPIDHGIVGHVARSGEPALVNQVRTDSHYVTYLPDTGAKLVLPIKKEARVLGVLSLESSRPQGFSRDDLRFAIQLAELAAIAMDNARLFQQVREGRDNLQAIVDSTREAILVIDRDNCITLANPMIEELSGISATELVGMRVDAMLGEPDPRVARLFGYPLGELSNALTLLDSASDRVSKRTYEMPEPRSRYIEQVAAPVIDKDGLVIGRLIVFRDVTEERRLAVMRQDLTDMIIHDLRSPLTAVVGGVQVARDLTEMAAGPDKIQHALNMAAESCNRLVTLVDSLLDISRLEAGQMPLERRFISLPALADSVIQELKPLAESDLISLQLQAIARVPDVYADEELIRRVLVNLVDNALKHSPRNSTVTVKIVPQPVGELDGPVTADAENGTQPPAAAVRCTVLDMGPGIPEEFRERVFDRFAQLGGRRTGKGLGLAFCKLAVQAHDGRVWVENNPRGRGSAFQFTLPAVLPDQLPEAESRLAA